MWIHIQKKNPVCFFDATGSVIPDIMNEKIPLLYSLVCHDYETRSIIPFFEFISTKHDEDAIATNLFSIKKMLDRSISKVTQFVYPPIIVTDFQWALINSLSDVFNRCDIKQYIDWCYNVLVKTEVALDTAIKTRIILCSTHILKSIIQKIKRINMNDENLSKILENKKK